MTRIVLGPSNIISSFLDSGAISIAPRSAQKLGSNLLPNHALRPSVPSINMVSSNVFLFDPSELITLPRTIVCAHVRQNISPLVAYLHYSPTNPFLIGGPTPLQTPNSCLRIWLD